MWCNSRHPHAESALHLIICETLTWLEPPSQAHSQRKPNANPSHMRLWTCRCVCLCDCTNIENNKMDKHNCLPTTHRSPLPGHLHHQQTSPTPPQALRHTHTLRHNNILQECNKEFLIRSHMVFPGLYSPFFVCKRYEHFVYKNPNIIDRILSMFVCMHQYTNKTINIYMTGVRKRAVGWWSGWLACTGLWVDVCLQRNESRFSAVWSFYVRVARFYIYIPAVMATCVLCNARLWVGGLLWWYMY